MSKEKEDILSNCSKEQLIYIIQRYEKSLYNISEICVEESKCHMSSEKSITEIRKNLNVLNDISYLDMHDKLPLLMGDITKQEYRKRIGLD